VLEDRFGAEFFTEAQKYKAVGNVFDDGLSRQFVGEVCLKPAFWPTQRDSFALMSRARFRPELREQAILDLTANPRIRATARMLSFLGAVTPHRGRSGLTSR